ncbi:hypothetical protein Purlil1_14279 [Purpureocillium lilacinum]|uniref:Uncharacterized protein n=1 Tax=Purpureocillium lilacinum TaxID=33203 RepID=A0ABR0BBU5_PURLI|nr:hypothetical protein Purlil1_14279 [Purpureocillium lilacinum]
MSSSSGLRDKGARRIAPAPTQNNMSLPSAQPRVQQKPASRTSRSQQDMNTRLLRAGAQFQPTEMQGMPQYYARSQAVSRPPEHLPRSHSSISSWSAGAGVVSGSFGGSAPALVTQPPPTRSSGDNDVQERGDPMQSEAAPITFEDLIHDQSAEDQALRNTFDHGATSSSVYNNQDFTLDSTVSYGSDTDAASPSDALESPGQSTPAPTWPMTQPGAAEVNGLLQPPSYLPLQTNAAVQPQGSRHQHPATPSILQQLHDLNTKMSTLQGNVTTLQTASATLQGSVSALQGRVSDVERQLGCSSGNLR